MKILLVEDDEATRQLIRTCLEIHCEAQVTESRSGNDAIELIKSRFERSEKEPYDIIVSDYHMPDGSGGDLFKYLLSIGSKSPFVVVSGDQHENLPEFVDHEIAGFIQKPVIVKPMIRLMKSIVKNQKQLQERSQPLWCEIKLKTLLKVNLLSCDLYLKLSETKYVRVTKKGESFGETEYDKYMKKGVDRGYIRIEEFDKFLEDFLANLLALKEMKRTDPESVRKIVNQIEDEEIKKDLATISKTLKTSSQNKINQEYANHISTQALNGIHKMYHKLGVTEEIEALVKASVGVAIKAIGEIPGLAELFKKMSVDNENYLSSHSSILAHVVCVIAEKLKWTSDLTRHKLCLAAFLHDLPLADSNLARIQRLDTQTELELGQETVQTIRAHPERGAMLVRKFHQIPPDVDLIVLQHHERPDGSGFPEGVNGLHINPLATAFIVAHDLVSFVASGEGDELDFQGFIEAEAGQYQSGYFKKIAEVLRKQIKA